MQANNDLFVRMSVIYENVMRASYNKDLMNIKWVRSNEI